MCFVSSQVLSESLSLLSAGVSVTQGCKHINYILIVICSVCLGVTMHGYELTRTENTLKIGQLDWTAYDSKL